MSTDQTNAPRRRSSAANKRRRTQAAASQAPVQETVSEAVVTAEPVPAAAPVDRNLQKREERKAAKAKKEERHGINRVVDSERFSGVKQFYRDTMSEIRKVIWPTREQTRNLTLLVIGMATILGFILGGLDFVLLRIFEAIG